MAKDENGDSGDLQLAQSFGRCVSRHREAANLSASELARKAGMSRHYIWRVENGQTMANLRTIGRLSRALDVPIHSLCEGVDTSGISLTNRQYDKD